MKLNLIQIRAAIDNVTFPGVHFSVKESEYEGPVLVIETTLSDSDDLSKDIDLRIVSFIPPCDSVDAFLRWLTYRMCRIATHEVRELLRFNGERVSNPHEDEL